MKPRLDRVQLNPSGSWVWRCSTAEYYGLGTSKEQAYRAFDAIRSDTELKLGIAEYEVAVAKAVVSNARLGFPTHAGEA